MKYGEIKKYARLLRNNPTPAEALLWRHIRNRQLDGRKFLRQHPLLYEFFGNEYFYFIPDFYCYAELLIIELDGSVHDYQLDRDKKREAILVQSGFRIIRFRNQELNNIDYVLETIKSNFKNDIPPSPILGKGVRGIG